MDCINKTHMAAVHHTEGGEPMISWIRSALAPAMLPVALSAGMLFTACGPGSGAAKDSAAAIQAEAGSAAAGIPALLEHAVGLLSPEPIQARMNPHLDFQESRSGFICTLFT